MPQNGMWTLWDSLTIAASDAAHRKCADTCAYVSAPKISAIARAGGA